MIFLSSDILLVISFFLVFFFYWADWYASFQQAHLVPQDSKKKGDLERLSQYKKNENYMFYNAFKLTLENSIVEEGLD